MLDGVRGLLAARATHGDFTRHDRTRLDDAGIARAGAGLGRGGDRQRKRGEDGVGLEVHVVCWI